jgi:hypothetical protein
VCEPELCKGGKSKKRQIFEGTKTKRKNWQEPTFKASELEGTITNLKEKRNE